MIGLVIELAISSYERFITITISAAEGVDPKFTKTPQFGKFNVAFHLQHSLTCSGNCIEKPFHKHVSMYYKMKLM